jgi:hypothetical protein
MASIITPCVTARLDAVFKVLFRTGEAQPICDRDALPSRWRTSRSLHKAARAPVNSSERQFQPPRESCAGRRHRSSPYRLPQARCPVSALPSPTALVDPVGWLMFLSSKTTGGRIVGNHAPSVPRRMVRRSCRPSLASFGGVRDRGVGKAVRKEINGRTARSWRCVPCWNGFVWN